MVGQSLMLKGIIYSNSSNDDDDGQHQYILSSQQWPIYIYIAA